MTNEEREEALAIMNVIIHMIDREYDNDRVEKAVDMAIEALKAEPCEDAIKREAVLNTLDTMDKALDENRTVETYKELLKECYKTLPPVTPKPRTGKWITHKHDMIEYLECDQCRVFVLHEHLVRNSFCPNCGAKMEGESE